MWNTCSQEIALSGQQDQLAIYGINIKLGRMSALKSPGGTLSISATSTNKTVARKN